MPWRYKKLKNDYNKDQIFDCSQSPKRAVCSDCHLSYTNTGDGLSCSDCRGVHDEDREEGQTTTELTNKYGFIDHVLVENGEISRFESGEPIPVCPQCKCHVTANTGQGTMCGPCQYESDSECEHDYPYNCLF